MSVRARVGKAGLMVLATDIPPGCFPAGWSSHYLSHWEVMWLKRSRHTCVPDKAGIHTALGQGHPRSQAAGVTGRTWPENACLGPKPAKTWASLSSLPKGDEVKKTHVLVRTGQGRGGKVMALHTHSFEESLTVSVILTTIAQTREGTGTGETGRKRALPAKTDGQGPH